MKILKYISIFFALLILLPESSLCMRLGLDEKIPGYNSVFYGAVQHIPYSFLYNHHNFSILSPQLIKILNTKKNDRFAGYYFMYPKRPYAQDHVTLEIARDLWDFEYSFKKVAYKMRQRLAQTYKIHIMPQDHHLNDVIAVLLKKQAENKINVFKIYDCGFLKKKNGEEIKDFARIVIYAKGREKAQAILNDLYTEFKGLDGLKDAGGKYIVPDFNANVARAPCLYIAQGDRDHKRDKDYQSYYDQSLNRIYYAPDFEGVKKDYKLYHPENCQMPLIINDAIYIPREKSLILKTITWFKKHIPQF